MSKHAPLNQPISYQLALKHLRCHVPGHAGRWLGASQSSLLKDAWFSADLTELEGLDVLSEPDGCLAKAQAAYAEACQVGQTFFLTNGSTSGLLAAMLARGLTEADTVLLPRNAHRSVISGLVLTGAKPVWFYPRWEAAWGLWRGLTADDLPDCLPADAKALIITSPTYEGLGSDVAALAAWCRQRGLYCIVDEAHGALWPFLDALPHSACNIPGVDAVIQSSHKTLGSLTQTAVLHLPFGSRLDAITVQQAINLVHTSSPSYPLMLSLDAIRAHWQTEAGQAYLKQWHQQLIDLREGLLALPHLSLFQPDNTTGWDPSRIVLRHNRWPDDNRWAVALEARLNLPYEALTHNAATYVWGVGLQPADADRFLAVFKQADRLPTDSEQRLAIPEVFTAWNQPNPVEVVLTPRQAFFSPGEKCPVTEAVGRIAKQTVVHCPPGIPVVQHGERIHSHHLPFLPADGITVVKD